MKRLLFVLVLFAAGILALGFYRGWFQVGSENAEGKSNVTLSVDTKKLEEDRKSAVSKAQDVGRQIKDTVAGPKDKAVVDPSKGLESKDE